MSYTHACFGCQNIIQTNSYFGPAYCPVCLATKNQREKDAVNNPVNYVSDEACKAAFAQAAAQEKATASIIVGVIAVIAGIVLIPIILPIIIMAIIILLPVAIVAGIVYAIVVAVKKPPNQGP